MNADERHDDDLALDPPARALPPVPVMSADGYAVADPEPGPTAPRFTVRRAYGTNIRTAGWDVFDGEEWAQRFHYKRTALDVARMLNEQPR